MIYRVNIGYHRFDIPDGHTALSFAELAKKYQNNEKGYETPVTIDVLNDEEVAADE